MTLAEDHHEKVLIIDDDPAMLDLLDDMLKNEFQVKKCLDAEAGIQSLHLNKPSLIILDINLGNAHGIDTAKMIKLDPINNDIPIIFISGLATREDKIAGYEAGAIDFIGKPFSYQEIIRKVRLNINFQTLIEERNQTIDETRQMAFTAMAQSGEMGQVLHFIRDSFTCGSYDAIAQRILEYMESQQLNTALYIKTDPPMYASHDKEIARLDREILERLSKFERIIDFGKRTVYNFVNISILIKDMPLSDDNLYGRIKDNVCLILEAADTKINDINNESSLHKQNRAMVQAIDSSKQILTEIEISFQKNATTNAAIMSLLKEKIEWSFLQLGLSEEQESEILSIVEKAEKSTISLYDSGLQIEERIIGLSEKFSVLVENKH